MMKFFYSPNKLLKDRFSPINIQNEVLAIKAIITPKDPTKGKSRVIHLESMTPYVMEPMAEIFCADRGTLGQISRGSINGS